MSDIRTIISDLVAVWNGADLDSLNGIVDENIRRISSPTTLTNANGLDDLKRVITEARTMMPDFHVSIEDTVVGEDKSALFWRATGTHTGTTEALPATGRSFTVDGITFQTYSGGKLIEERVAFDNLHWLVQLGILENPIEAKTEADLTDEISVN
ncbi:MAG: hypothetical protein BMS9Abin05_1611 [Rhodothermia bacterium]|nr:MAG: hypothetical protein BMS9Abin05_1611 [Rhodothermia bacterium]